MYQCPKCGSTDNLEVVVEVWATLIQTDDDNLETDTSTPDDGDHEWGDNSAMRCRDCDFSDIAEKFTMAKQEDAQHAS